MVPWCSTKETWTMENWRICWFLFQFSFLPDGAHSKLSMGKWVEIPEFSRTHGLMDWQVSLYWNRVGLQGWCVPRIHGEQWTGRKIHQSLVGIKWSFTPKVFWMMMYLNDSEWVFRRVRFLKQLHDQCMSKQFYTYVFAGKVCHDSATGECGEPWWMVHSQCRDNRDRYFSLAAASANMNAELIVWWVLQCGPPQL